MYSKIVCVVFVATFVCSAAALPKQDTNEKDLVNMINKIDNEPSIPLFGGLHVERVETGRAFGVSNKAIETFEERAERYLQSHQLNFSFPDTDEEEEEEFNGRAIEETRSKKMKKMLVPLLLALKLKKAVIVKVLFMIIKFISLKSLVISFLALFFAGATFFKDLLGKKKEHITTAYITGSPLNAEIVHSDWNRNGQASASDLAYNHYETRSKKMKKMLVPLLLALKLKKAVIVKVLFMIIKFISLKSLVISFLALFFAGATFFKDLLGKKKEHITTAYITGSPLNAEIVHSDWNRNGQASASDLAYNHYGLAQPF